MAVKVNKIWPLERYARFVSDPQQAGLLQKEAKKWQHYCSKDGSIQLALLESNHLMISSGKQIYVCEKLAVHPQYTAMESFSLWDTRKWIKGVTKGDSILFIYRLGEENRRFRVKFASMSPTTTSLETCKSCIATLTPLVPIREMAITALTGGEPISDSQMPYEDTQLMSQAMQLPEASTSHGSTAFALQSLGAMRSTLPGTMCSQNKTVESLVNSGCSVTARDNSPDESDLLSVPDLAKSLSQGKSLGRAYAETNVPTEQLGAFIRLCLTDTNFPGFVEAVEKELNTITAGK